MKTRIFIFALILICSSSLFSQSFFECVHKTNLLVSHKTYSELLNSYSIVCDSTNNLNTYKYIVEDSVCFYLKATDSLCYHDDSSLCWDEVRFFTIIQKSDSLILDFKVRYNVGGMAIPTMIIVFGIGNRVAINIPSNVVFDPNDERFSPIYFIEYRDKQYAMHEMITHCSILTAIYEKLPDELNMSDIIYLSQFAIDYVHKYCN